MDPLEAFGAWVKRRRRSLALTQDELAQRVAYSIVTIRKIESGDLRPSKALAAVLAEALEISLDERPAFIRFARNETDPREPTPLPSYALPSAPAPAPTPTNLPTPLTSLIGRQTELATIGDLLHRPGGRLVTLAGPPGVGKTRLALAVAAGAMDAYPDGVWFIELAPVSDPALIGQSAASILGLQEAPGRAPATALAEHLRARRALLMLDNCEHIVYGCARFADALLRAAPQVCILATSLEPLGIAGEQVYRVSVLTAPDPRRREAVATLMQYDSVKLFVERATAVHSSFEVSSANAEAVAQVCYHLDGVPLAIELAAARVRGMKVEQIAQHIDSRFRLLTGGSRTDTPRHQSLRATIDWSHTLLSEQDASVFRRLAVFNGGWSIEAAEAVCATGGVSPADVLDALFGLVDKSLIAMDDRGAETRYHMLETIHAYARDRLLDAGEAEAAEDRRLAFFVQWVEATMPAMDDPKVGEALACLETDLSNLRAALEWSLANDVEAGLRLAGAMGAFWWMRGHRVEGVDWLRRLLAPASPPTSARARALRCGADLLFVAEGNAAQESRIWLEESLAIERQLGDLAGEADTLLELGRWAQFQTDWQAAGEFFAASVQASERLGDRARVVRALNQQGGTYYLQGDMPAARTAYRECLRMYREMGQPQAAWWPLGNLGSVALAVGDLAEAASWCEQTLAILREMGEHTSSGTAGWMLRTLCEIAARQGRYDAAQEYLDQCLALEQCPAADPEAGLNRLNVAFLAYCQGDYNAAATAYGAALALLKAQKVYSMLAVEGLARAAGMQGAARQAVVLFGAAAAMREANGMRPQPIEQADNERAMAAVRAQLDEDAIAEAWAAGRALTSDQAVAYALDQAFLRESHGRGAPP